MLANRVQETTATTGSGSFTTAGAVAGFQSFNTAFGTTRRFFYWAINDTDNESEAGIGYLSASTTLVRETILTSSNANAVVTFTTAPSLFCSDNSTSSTPSTGQVVSNQWYCPYNDTDHAYRSTFLMTANTIYLTPAIISFTNNIDQIGIGIQTESGTKFRLGIYECINGAPGGLIVETGDLAVTSGYQAGTITSTNITGRVVFLGVIADGALRIFSSTKDNKILLTEWLQNSTGYPQTPIYETIGSWSAMPVSIGSITTLDAQTPPKIQVYTV
jgi:hypothetical protein